MTQATTKLYIRFGNIPADGHSKCHLGDDIIKTEAGISVFQAVREGSTWYPLLPEDANENAVADYFDLLFDKDAVPVLLVTGEEIRVKGSDGEPLLQNPIIVKDLTEFYRSLRNSAYSKEAQLLNEIETKPYTLDSDIESTSVYCFCGSMRFKKEMYYLQQYYIFEKGACVLLPEMTAEYIPGPAIKASDEGDENGRIILNRFHLNHYKKMAIADKVCIVTNRERYIGEDTQREIDMAAKLSIKLRFLDTWFSKDGSTLYANIFDSRYVADATIDIGTIEYKIRK